MGVQDSTAAGGPVSRRQFVRTVGALSGIVSRAVLSWIEARSLAPFLNGDAVMHRNWPYAILSASDESAIFRPVTVVWGLESQTIAQRVHVVAQRVHVAYSGLASPERAMAELETQLRLVENYNEGLG